MDGVHDREAVSLLTVDERIVVLVSGSGSNMEALARACDRGEVRGRVVAVVSDRPCRGIDRAAAMGIPCEALEPALYADRDAWSEALAAMVRSYTPDLVVSAGFMRILGPSFVDAFAGRLINLHPSLLPAFPGAHAVRDALDRGVKVTGTTVHFVDYEVDHGPILLQEAVPVEDGDTVESLHDRIKETEHRLLPRACDLLLRQSGSVGAERGAGR
jgi:phosphoribosylglycinamide formyltransferase 1